MKNIFTNKLKGIIIVVLERIRDFIFYGLLLGFTVITIEKGSLTLVDFIQIVILFLFTIMFDFIIELSKNKEA